MAQKFTSSNNYDERLPEGNIFRKKTNADEAF